MGLMNYLRLFNAPLKPLNLYKFIMGNLNLFVMTGRAFFLHVNSTLNGSSPAKSVAEGMERGLSIWEKIPELESSR